MRFRETGHFAKNFREASGAGKVRMRRKGANPKGDNWNARIRVVYSDHDGGWYRVMRDENCVTDFRDPKCADSYARALRKEARANTKPQT